MMNQKEAVFQAVTTVLAENNVNFEKGTDVRTILTSEHRAQVKEILIQAFIQKEIELDGDRDEAYIKSYVPGLITNHLGKDVRLNGGNKYQAKNPGSRFGSNDDQLKALKALKTQLTMSNASTEEIAEIDTHITNRTNELKAAKPAKAKTVNVNFADLPADLQAKYAK